MTKRLLSMALSLALLLSCVSGITLFAAAEDELPTPYLYIDATAAVLQSNTAVGGENFTPTAIGDTGLYGLCIPGDWKGFWADGSPLSAVPEGTSVTMVVEYYFTEGAHSKAFRYQLSPTMETAGEDPNKADVWVGASPIGQSVLLTRTLSAEELAVYKQDVEVHPHKLLRFWGTANCAGTVYVRSVKFVKTEYVDVFTDGGYACCDVEGRVISPYYPDVKTVIGHNLAVKWEQTNFMGFVVSGDQVIADKTQTAPKLLKVYTKAGYENTTLPLGDFETNRGNRWAASNGISCPILTVTDGVGTALLKEASFSNSTNGYSFRFTAAEAAKIARVELYDLNTCCAKANASDATKTELHAWMLQNDYNLVDLPRKEASYVEAGHEAATLCATCDAVLEGGEEIPMKKDDSGCAHIEGELQGVCDPTCTEPGYTGDRFCTLGCGVQTVYGEVIPALGHTEVIEGAVTPGYGTAGHTGNVVCTVCGEMLEEGKAIAALPNERPFAEITTDGGVLYSTLPLGTENGGTTDVVAIGDTGEYGILLDGDWKGVNMTGAMLSNLAPGQSVTLVIEYYVHSDTVKHQQFRFYPSQYAVANQAYDAHWQNVFATEYDIVTRRSGLIFYTYTAEELAAIGDGEFTVKISGCDNQTTYLQSMRLIKTDYVAGNADPGYSYFDFSEKPLCDYYPTITVPNAYNVTARVREAHTESRPEFNGYRYFSVTGGEALIEDYTKNKPLLFKFYAKEGFEDAEIHGGEYDMSGGSIHHQPTDSYYTWSRFGTVTLADGEASVFVDAGLANRLNGVGSFRFEEDQAAALQRVEIYDVSTYCAEAAATDEMIAVMHEYMLANGVNLRREGNRPSTKEECGATGDVYCATCDTLLEESRELPKLPDFGDLPEPYAWFDTNGGALATSEGDTLIKHGGAVNLTPVAIGDTGEYGIKLSHNWQGLNFVVDLADLPDGKGVSLLIEYYADMEWEQSGLQLFRYNYTHNEHNNNDQNSRDDDHFDMLTGRDGLKSKQSALAVQHFTAAEVAAMKASGENHITVLGAEGGVGAVYIQSVMLVDNDAMNLPEDRGYDYISYEEEVVCDYYPDIKDVVKGGITGKLNVEGVNANGPIRYYYFYLTQTLLKEGAALSPVIIEFTFDPAYEATEFGWEYQAAPKGSGKEWRYTTTPMTENGVVQVILEDAYFTNGLNGGSFRMMDNPVHPDVTHLKGIKVIALPDKTPLKEMIAAGKELTKYKTPASVAAYNAVVDEVKAVVNDPLATEQAVADAVAALQAAADALEDCLHEGGTKLVNYQAEDCLNDGYSGDNACADCGFIAEDAKGTVIPKHETRTINRKDPTCAEKGNSGDLWCDVCQKIVRNGDPILELPHTFNGDGVVTKPATKDERGEITRTCTVCGHKEVVEFDFVAEMGDVNGDGKIDSTDARLTLQFAVRKISATALDAQLADVDGNGKIDSTDARLILQYAVGKIQSFSKV